MDRGGGPSIAITRRVARSIARCELSFVPRIAIDVDRARREHEAYCAALVAAGCDVVTLDENEAEPDGCFVEDTAVVFGEIAIITVPGALSRRAETVGVAAVLARHRPLERITLPGTLDGGDVLVMGRRVFVGRSARTNDAGIGQLRTIVERHGGTVVVVDVAHCLHLKTAVTALGPDTLLAHRPALTAAFDAGTFAGFRIVDADAAAANALRVGEHVWLPRGQVHTCERVADAGFSVQERDLTELAKAEAGLTCLSVLLP